MQRLWERQVLLAVCAVTAAGCAPAKHYLIHPRQPPAAVRTSSHDVYRDELLVHLEVARPVGPGPFAVVIVALGWTDLRRQRRGASRVRLTHLC
jgi:hypothetical protein